VPASHPRRGELVAILGRLAAAVGKVQDPKTGVFWQVLDKGGREGNYLESSASVMFSYALMKGARQDALEPRFGALGRQHRLGTVRDLAHETGKAATRRVWDDQTGEYRWVVGSATPVDRSQPPDEPI